MQKQEGFRGNLEMIASMTIAGTIGWFVVMSEQSPETAVFWRCLFGATFMLLVCLYKDIFKQVKLNKPSLILLTVGGVALSLNWLFLFKSFSLSSIAIATITYHIEPFILVLLGAIFFKEHISTDKVLWLICAFLGTIFIIVGKQEGGAALTDKDTYLQGVFYAVIAASFYAIAAITAKKLKHIPPHIIVAFQLFIGIFVLLPFTPLGDISAISAVSWSFLVTIGIIHTGLMCLLLYSAIQKIPTALVGALSFIYPVVAVIVDWAAFDTRLTLLQFAGASAILIGAAGVNLNWRITKKKLKENRNELV